MSGNASNTFGAGAKVSGNPSNTLGGGAKIVPNSAKFNIPSPFSSNVSYVN